MCGWERALAVFATKASDRLTWMLVGSAATSLHGAAVVPGDVDVLVHPDTHQDNMLECATSLVEYTGQDTPSEDLDLFLSSPACPLIPLSDGSWLFGRWMVQGCKLELARIRTAVAPPVVLETMGTAVWDTRQHVLWHGLSIPVVPLEVQLATIMSRAQVDRERAVQARLTERGFDSALLSRAMADRGVA